MAESLSTQVLIQNFQNGDRNALDELYGRYWKRVLSAVRLRLGKKLRRKLESADVVQRVMMDALREVELFDFRTEGAFMKFLNKRVENRIRDEADRWQAGKRNIDREVSLDGARSDTGGNPLNDMEVSTALTPGGALVLKEDLGRLEQAMDILAERYPEYHELLIAVKIEGRTYREIAQESGDTVDAVRMRNNRALSALIAIFHDLDQRKPA